MCRKTTAKGSCNILPAFSKNNIAVCFEVSNIFVPSLSVAVLSLINCATDEYNYDVIILSSEISVKDEALLQSMSCNYPNISIRVFNPDSLIETYIENACYRYLEINYYRMALPWILKHYDRVINLGADVLIKRNVADLFYEKMEDTAYLGGAVDLAYQGRLALDISQKELGLEDASAYVNADVLLMNLSGIRRNFSQQDVMLSWQRRFFRCSEQDAMNWLFQGHIHHIDLKWNVFPANMSSEFDILHAPASSVLRWKESLLEPYIIHYAALPKPWQLPCVGYGTAWWCVARKSPYYEELLKNMAQYIEQHRRSNMIDSDSKTLIRKLLPAGSIRRKALTTVVPKGSIQWCLLKKVQYRIQIRNHRIIKNKGQVK